MRVVVVVFPGSNCEFDCEKAFTDLGCDVQLLWHSAAELPDCDLVVLPGGFAHGDYLRTGAIARFSPVMDAVRSYADRGGLVIGICNGFQVLCEAGMLPGALRKNAGLKFLCRWVDLRVENADTPFTSRAEVGRVLRIPINHFEGNWYCTPEELDELKGQNRILVTYVDNPNGSLENVAGITNEDGNVFGLMPHPERACEDILGSADGRVIFGSIVDHVTSLQASAVSAAG